MDALVISVISNIQMLQEKITGEKSTFESLESYYKKHGLKYMEIWRDSLIPEYNKTLTYH